MPTATPLTFLTKCTMKQKVLRAEGAAAWGTGACKGSQLWDVDYPLT